MLRFSRAAPFSAPVPAAEGHAIGYFDVIRRPMDLGTVSCNLCSMKYPFLADFVADVHLVFDNAMTFNDPASKLHRDALALRLQFDAALENLTGKDTASLCPPPDPSGVQQSTAPPAPRTRGRTQSGASGSVYVGVFLYLNTHPHTLLQTPLLRRLWLWLPRRPRRR
jgi:hypothetical protein